MRIAPLSEWDDLDLQPEAVVIGIALACKVLQSDIVGDDSGVEAVLTSAAQWHAATVGERRAHGESARHEWQSVLFAQAQRRLRSRCQRLTDHYQPIELFLRTSTE